MRVSFEYSNADFEDWQQAQSEFFAPKAAASSQGGFGRNLFGWILFVALAAMFSYLLIPGVGPPGHAHPPTATHNATAIILPLWIPMLLVTAFFGFTTSRKSGRIVPFYEVPAPKQYAGDSLLFGWLPLLLAAGIGIIWFFTPKTPNWTPSAMGLALAAGAPYVAGIFVMSMVLKFRRSGRDFLGHEGSSMRGPRTLEVIPEGLRFSTRLITWELYWPHVVSYLESKETLALYTSDATVYLIPKRAFPSPDAFDQFCAVIQNNISKGQFRPRLAAFPVVAPRPVLPLQENTGVPVISETGERQ